jgi:GTP cyclohydrolase I
MKLNGISLYAKDNLIDLNEMMGDEHVMTSLETPMKSDAFILTNKEKKAKIAQHFEQIMETLGLDLTDDSLKGTPARVAKMYVEEVFSGLDPKNKPKVALFENKYLYKEMLVEKDITVKSFCEHHFVPIVGRAHVAYKSNGNVIGLSKINRVVQYFARRPQVQERLTVQIAEELKGILETDDVAVMIDARHMCVSLRGVQDDASSTVTTSFHGAFLNDNVRSEFLTYLD